MGTRDTRRSNRARRRCGAAIATAAIAASSACAPPPAPGQSYRVPADFGEAAVTAARDLFGPPPGANLADCTPTAAHPRPVVLAHGILGNMADNMGGLAPELANQGYCVYALTYGAAPGSIFGGIADIRRSSIDEFGPFVDRVLAATGARQVDVIGHSEGSVMPRWWMRYGDSVHPDGTPKVANMIGVAPVSNGDDLGGLATQMRSIPLFAGVLDELAKNGCGACEKLVAGSSFFRQLNTTAPQPGERFSGPAQPGVRYLMLASVWENFVVPYRSGFIDHPAVTNMTLQDACPIDEADHLAIAFDPVAYDLVSAFLDPTHPIPQRCVATQPVFWRVDQRSGLQAHPVRR